MANLLTIGCNYLPNVKVKAADGSQTKESFVEFYFNCDARTANMIYGSGLIPNVRVDGDSLVKKVKASQYKDFIYGKKAFPKILGELEKYGYVYDTSQLDALNASVEQEINNFAQSGVQKKIDNDVYDFIEQLIDAMEKNLSDPNFMAFLDSIGSIQRFVGNGNIDDLTELTYENKFMILTQWVKSGHSGHPTFVATKKQFLVGGYKVNPNATPLYFVFPTDVIKSTVRKTMGRFGVKAADYNADDLLKVQIERLANDKDFGNNNAKKFSVGEPYYDISECTPFRQSNLEDKIKERNVQIDPNATKDDIDKKKSDAVANINVINQNILSDDTMCGNAKKYAEKIGDKKLASVASRGVARDVVKFLAENAESYLRNSAQRYGQHSNETKALLEAIALKKLGLGDNNCDRIIVQNCGNLRRNGKANRLMFITVASDVENIYYIMSKGINESVDNSMLMYVLNCCGISVDEFKNMPKDEMEAEAMTNGVRESFIRTFNKLLITH